MQMGLSEKEKIIIMNSDDLFHVMRQILLRENKISREQGLKEGKKNGLKEGKKIGMEKGLKKGKIQMAKTMKKKGEPIEKILEYTGLSKEEIEKL